MPRPNGRRATTLLTLVLLALALAPAWPVDPAAARNPELCLHPNVGEPGITVLARGRDFPPGAIGTIAWGDLSRSFGDFTTDAGGRFELAVTVPDLPPGAYTVTAITPAALATATFTIDSSGEIPELSATPAPVLGATPAATPDFAPNACDEPASRAVTVTTDT